MSCSSMSQYGSYPTHKVMPHTYLAVARAAHLQILEVAVMADLTTTLPLSAFTVEH